MEIKMKLKIYSKKHGEQIILIDNEDYDKIKDYKWNIAKICNSFYAVTNIKGSKPRKQISMHRLLMDNSSGDIDHINHNGLDNRRSVNLRFCTRSENCMN